MKSVSFFIASASLALAACSAGEKEADDIREAVDGADTATAPAAEPTDPAAAYEGPIPMPIKVGSDGPEMDACGSVGMVANLNPDGDNYLSVRDSPSTLVKERDRLDSGQSVTICGESDGWYGVVYSKTDEDCGLGSPVATEENYTGPCMQGWVDGRFVEVTAG